MLKMTTCSGWLFRTRRLSIAPVHDEVAKARASQDQVVVRAAENKFGKFKDELKQRGKSALEDKPVVRPSYMPSRSIDQAELTKMLKLKAVFLTSFARKYSYNVSYSGCLLSGL
ncbi:hypothetical protein Droror1_Dr00023963 [Drosera rotundifolia]